MFFHIISNIKYIFVGNVQFLRDFPHYDKIYQGHLTGHSVLEFLLDLPLVPLERILEESVRSNGHCPLMGEDPILHICADVNVLIVRSCVGELPLRLPVSMRHGLFSSSFAASPWRCRPASSKNRTTASFFASRTSGEKSSIFTSISINISHPRHS